MIEELEWFETWFDTKYYHILYKDRDYTEAEFFIRNLMEYLKPDRSEEFLDLACGKGRHSIYLNKLGYKVKGLDLSENSIAYANKYASDTLKFDVHDMREVYKPNAFNYILNIFTSFGYFENFEDNEKVMKSISEMLKPKGKFVLDFLNLNHVLDHLVEEEVKVVDGIEFHMTREFDGTFIIKHINFHDNGKDYAYHERVQAISKKEFEGLLEANNFKKLDVFGDFALSAFDEKKSDRLIIIAEKE